MRIDLEHGGRRPWIAKIGLAVANRVLGFKPPPVLAVTYRPDLLHPALRRYITRGVSAHSSWTKGQSELFAAFVSDLNRCHF